MDTETISARVGRILVREFGAPEDLDLPNARLVEDLGLDSLDRCELAIGIEDELSVEISDEELGAWETVADIVACVEGKIGA